jgi:hypothetical protein
MKNDRNEDWSRRKFLRKVGVASAIGAGLRPRLGGAGSPEEAGASRDGSGKSGAAPAAALKKACVWGMLYLH